MLYQPTPPTIHPQPSAKWGPVLPQHPPLNTPAQQPTKSRQKRKEKDKDKDKDKERELDSDEDDVPTGPWDNMYYLAEAARLKADNKTNNNSNKNISPAISPVPLIPLKGTDFGDPLGAGSMTEGSNKKRKRSALISGTNVTMTPIPGVGGVGTGTGGKGKGKTRWNKEEVQELKRNLPIVRGREGQESSIEIADPIILGFCTEDEGRRLYNLSVFDFGS